MKIPVVFIILLIMQFFSYIYASVSVRMYSLEEALSETNLSKPRIYIQNTGTEPISNITYNYYFTAGNGRVPLPDDYWTENEDIHLVSDGNSRYHIRYVINGTLQPGQLIPENSGNVVGLHYNNWGPWDKTNDYSNNQSSTFIENEHIVVYSNGVKIYGILPDSTTGDKEPDEALEFHSFALYATDSAKVLDSTTFSGGGAIGSNTNVDVGNQSIVNGNVICKQNVLLRGGSTVNGDVYVNGIVNTHIGATINGILHENAQVATLTIPVKTVSAGTIDQTISSNSTITLQPGNYRNVYIDSLGTLILLPGTYSFKEFLLQANAKVQINATVNQTVYLNVDKELEFQDQSEVKFQLHSYSPALQIYTNDTSAIKVGVGAKLNGIISAPYGNVTMYSAAQCDGAIYAKKITVQNGVSVASCDVNPANDPDNDGVANLLEILTGTDPLDSTKFKIMLLPTPVYINNTNDVVVKLSAERFYEDLPKEDSIILSLPAGTLTNGRQAILMDINNTAVDFNGTSISNFSLPAGYSQVNRFFSLDPGTFGSNKNMTITIPFRKSDYLAANNYSLLYHIAGTSNWNLGSTTVSDISDSTVSITGTIQSPDAIVIVSKENASIIGYLDGAVITSDKTSEASISLDLEIKDISQNDTARAYITYSDYSSGSNPINTSFSVRFDNFQNEDGTYKLVANTGSAPHKSNNRMVVSEIRIAGAGVNYDYVVSSNNAVERGQNLLLSAHTQADNYNRSTSTVAWTFSNNFNIESIDLDGEGRIRTVGDSLSYDYYVKDHLGSTREVINDEGRVTEATMYYPYGTMVSLLKPPTGDNAREKFTGKELDAGDIPGNEVTYEFTIDNFDAGNRSYGCNLYVNYTDLSTNRNLTRVYPLTYHRSLLKYTLNTHERFPDSIKITHLNIATYNSPVNIQYEKDCNYVIKENGGIKISLNVNAQALIDNSSQDYYVPSSYETVRVVGSNLYYFGARYYDPEIGIFTSTDPASQYFYAYSYVNGNPIILVDPNGEWAGYLIGAVVGAYVGGAMANGSLNPGQWDWENPGTYFGMIQGGISGAMLGNSIEMNLAGASGNISDGYQGKGTVRHSTEGMQVVNEPAIEANDLQKFTGEKLSSHVQGKQDSKISRFLGHDKLEYKIGASSSGKYEIIAGTNNSVSTPPSWAKKYDIMMHSHPVGTGASAPSFQTTGKAPNDYLAVRQWRSAGYQGSHALYVPDTKTFFGYNSIYSNGMVTNSYWELLNVLP